MPRINVSVTEEFRRVLEAYREQNNLQSISEALVDLAAKQIGVDSPRPNNWGGNRKGEARGKKEGG